MRNLLFLALGASFAPAFASTITEYTIQVGAGPVSTYTSADGTFSDYPNFGYKNAATIFYIANTFGPFADLWFDAPGDVPLTPGVYSDAEGLPFQDAGSAGMWIAVNGEGFNVITGQFTVLEAVYGPTNTIQNFGADYVQFGDGDTIPWTGHVYYNFDPALVTSPEPDMFIPTGLGLLLAAGIFYKRSRQCENHAESAATAFAVEHESVSNGGSSGI